MQQVNPPILELDLPLAPGVNHLYAVVRGRKILSAEGRAYKAEVLQILSNGFTYEFIPEKTNLCFAATFYIPKSSFYRRDLDGMLKATIDSIFGAFKQMGGNLNDNRITELTVTKKLADKEDVEGSCNVEISLANEGVN